MNVINTYLDAMFSAYPQTPRLLEAKAELQGMMEDAYTSMISAGRTENEAVGQVISDFGNLEEVAPVLGISSDINPSSATGPAAAGTQYPPVTLEEAQGYATVMQRVRFRTGLAIMIFVISPALLIALPVAASTGALSISETAGVFIGLLVLLALVAVGIVLLLAVSRETAPFQHLPEGNFTPNPTVTLWAQSLAAEHERKRIRAIQIAIVLWILAPLPLIAFGMFLADTPQGEFWTPIGVVIVLVIVAAGLGILLPQTWAQTVAEELGQGKGSAAGSDEDSDVVGIIAAFYWPLLTAAYLAWSFIGDAWGISWIIWPIGGIIFGAIAGGSEAITRYRKGRSATR